MLALDAEMARRIRLAVRMFADQLARAVTGLPADRQGAIAASEDIARFLARRLEEEIARSTREGRTLSFQTTLDIWREAAERIARSRGVPGRFLGAIRTPPVSFLGAFEALGDDRGWRTILRGHIANAAEEATAVIRQGITQGLSQEQVSRQLRRYVTGADKLAAFTGEDGTIDLRRIPARLRGAANRVAYNADRIAITELNSARHEAEIQHTYLDPFVAANQWTLSPNRGAGRVPDACDLLARADWYGLGPGIFPVHATPSLPHPFDRCEVLPVTRQTKDIGKAKPAPGRQLGSRASAPGFDRLSDTAARAAREQALKAVVLGEAATRTRLRGRAAA